MFPPPGSDLDLDSGFVVVMLKGELPPHLPAEERLTWRWCAKRNFWDSVVNTFFHIALEDWMYSVSHVWRNLT